MATVPTANLRVNSTHVLDLSVNTTAEPGSDGQQRKRAMRSPFTQAFLILMTIGCMMSSAAGWSMLCTDQTSLSLNPANQEVLHGRECLFLHYPAEDPAEVRLSRDGEEVLYYRRGVDILQPPRNVCFSTEEIKPGPHVYTLEVNCEREVATATLT